MSVIIRGMDKPEDCDECLLSQWNYYTDMEYTCPFSVRHENCPLEQVESAERRGKWIFDGNFCGLNRHRCSECGKTEFRMSAYCPNCGAKMRGKDDD